MTYLPRDFVATPEGLVFAVVDRAIDGERIPCFLRYVRSGDGAIRKLDTPSAYELLRRQHPKYLFHCERRDAQLHGVAADDVAEHLRPRERMQNLLNSAYPTDPFEARTARLAALLGAAGVETANLGVTGSLLIGSHRAGSDIDLVCYDPADFERARLATVALIERGELAALDDAAWQDAYERRGCALSFEEFRWHETRKHNKAVFEGTKFDLSLVEEAGEPPQAWRKLGPVAIASRVTGDALAFGYPARLQIAHERIAEIVSFTATYVGQARRGEQIEVRGLLEEASDGTQRIVVGSDREASGQYIKVVC